MYFKIRNKIRYIFRSIRSWAISIFVYQKPSYLRVGRNVTINVKNVNNIQGGVVIMDGSSILGDVSIGSNVFIHENVLIRSFNHSISIGEGTTINRNTVIEAACKIGNYCSIAPNVVIVGANHGYENRNIIIKDQGSISKGIIIDDDVWVGANATILDGVHIWEGSVIAAGAVVTHDVYPFSVVAGVPARKIRERIEQ